MDAIFMGARAAIFDTKVPKTEVQDLGDGQFEFEVLDDAEDTDLVEGREDMPIVVTLNKVSLIHIQPLERRRKNGSPYGLQVFGQANTNILFIDVFSRSEPVILWMRHHWRNSVQRPNLSLL